MSDQVNILTEIEQVDVKEEDELRFTDTETKSLNKLIENESENCSYVDFKIAEKKLILARSRLLKSFKNGGNPLIFFFSNNKQHKIVDKISGQAGKGWMTAATDGKNYYWHPEFISALTIAQTQVVLEHESTHVILDHASPKVLEYPDAYNFAIDYIVNSGIYNRRRENGQNVDEIFTGALGQPLSLKDFINYLDGSPLPALKDGETAYCYADPELEPNLGSKDIYHLIKKHYEQSPRLCPECKGLNLDPKTGTLTSLNLQYFSFIVMEVTISETSFSQDDVLDIYEKNDFTRYKLLLDELEIKYCKTCLNIVDERGSAMGGGFGISSNNDFHIESRADRKQVLEDLEYSWQNTRNSFSNSDEIPDYLKELMKSLYEPELSAFDLIQQAVWRKSKEVGAKNDYTRYKRRLISSQVYAPMSYEFVPRILVLLDTSGSMTEDDLLYGLSQLKAIQGCSGVIVCVDTVAYWDEATLFENIDDIENIAIAGGGGTVFNQFFEEFKDRVGYDFDLIVCLTDGGFCDIPPDLDPGIDTVWVCTQSVIDLVPPFGRAAPMRTKSFREEVW